MKPTPSNKLNLDSNHEIHSLIPDILNLFDTGVDVSDSKAHQLGEAVAETVKKKMKFAGMPFNSEGKLYLSQIGKDDHLLYFNYKGWPQEEMGSDIKLRLMYGDIIEELLLWLAEMAGHEVTEKQWLVTVDDVRGRKDCRIDGVNIDVKSMSRYTFAQAEKGTFFDTAMGMAYIHQLSSYLYGEQMAESDSREPDENVGGFFAFDKDTGKMHLDLFNKEDLPNPYDRVKHLKSLFKKDTPPPPPKEGYIVEENGNIKIPDAYMFNPFKWEIWGDELRCFVRSNGRLEYYIHVEKTPRMDEVFRDGTIREWKSKAQLKAEQKAFDMANEGDPDGKQE
mgnify:CR=1 FL=1